MLPNPLLFGGELENENAGIGLESLFFGTSKLDDLVETENTGVGFGGGGSAAKENVGEDFFADFEKPQLDLVEENGFWSSSLSSLDNDNPL